MDCEVPLLLSEDAMKKAELCINVLTDTATIFEKKKKLLFISPDIIAYHLEITKGITL